MLIGVIVLYAIFLIVPLIFPGLLGTFLLIAAFSILVHWMRKKESLKFAGGLLIWGAVLLTGYHLFTVFLPMSSKASAWNLLWVDYKVSHVTDSLSLKADITKDIYKSEHFNEMMKTYRKYLSEGKVEEAEKLKSDFFKKWGGLQEGQSTHEVGPVIQGGGDTREMSFSESGCFGRGSHPLNLQRNKSKWISIDGCYNYNFNRDAKLTVTTIDGRTANSWEPGSWPTASRFLVTNVGDKDVILIVN